MIKNILRKMFINELLTLSKENILNKITTIIFFNIILILFSQIKLYLPFLPVPFTLQTFAILLISAILGYKYGTLVVVLYIIEGALGLPVFANFSNLSNVIGGYTLGYIIGFIPATFIFGILLNFLKKQNKINFLNLILVSFISISFIFFFGILWITYLTNNINLALAYGLYPFIITEPIKIIIASFVISKLYSK